MVAPSLTVAAVVPALDEAVALPALLDLLVGLDLDEVVVVDGGSRDATAALARAGRARVMPCARGRGRQLALGARSVTADVVWFVHADARPPRGAVDAIREALADPGVVGGAFRLHTVADGGRWSLGPLLRIADLRSRWTGLPYGDQALFVRREVLERAGGVPEIDLFEDLELARRLRRHGRLRTLPLEVGVSGRRFEANPLRALVQMHTLPVLYRLGVSPATLAAWYAPVRAPR